jgi:hypothetical protein
LIYSTKIILQEKRKKIKVEETKNGFSAFFYEKIIFDKRYFLGRVGHNQILDAHETPEPIDTIEII